MFSTRNLISLFRTPLIAPAPLPVFELTPLSSRPRAFSRTYSSQSSLPTTSPPRGARGYASEKGKKELYSDEAGSTGAGTDDVAHSKAAFDGEVNPEKAAEGVEEETGKDFTKRSPATEEYSKPTESK